MFTIVLFYTTSVQYRVPGGSPPMYMYSCARKRILLFPSRFHLSPEERRKLVKTGTEAAYDKCFGRTEHHHVLRTVALCAEPELENETFEPRKYKAVVVSGLRLRRGGAESVSVLPYRTRK